MKIALALLLIATPAFAHDAPPEEIVIRRERHWGVRHRGVMREPMVVMPESMPGRLDHVMPAPIRRSRVRVGRGPNAGRICGTIVANGVTTRLSC